MLLHASSAAAPACPCADPAWAPDTCLLVLCNSLLSGGEEWRCDDEEDVTSEDRARLIRRLETYSLCEHDIKGDGNCQVWSPGHPLACLPRSTACCPSG